MRGNSKSQNPIFFVANTEEQLPNNNPLHSIKRRAEDVLKGMGWAFDKAHRETARPGILPEALLNALLLQAVYEIASPHRLVEAVRWDLSDRWFCDIEPDAEMWDDTPFAHNRDPFERHGLVRKCFERLMATALVEPYASNDRFTTDGTLIQPRASLKCLRPKDKPKG